MVHAVASPQTGKPFELGALERTSLPNSMVVDQSKFLLHIEQLALGGEPRPFVSRFACDGISSALLPQLRSTLEIVLGSAKPSALLDCMQQAGVFRTFEHLEKLAHTPQDLIWHPEGSAWIHSTMVVDQAARLLCQLPIKLSATEQQGVMWGALLHDIGKSLTTYTRADDGRIVSPKHEAAGVELARSMLERLGIDSEIATIALAIVERHMAPSSLYRELDKGALRPDSYRRAVERLAVLFSVPATFSSSSPLVPPATFSSSSILPLVPPLFTPLLIGTMSPSFSPHSSHNVPLVLSRRGTKLLQPTDHQQVLLEKLRLKLPSKIIQKKM